MPLSKEELAEATRVLQDRLKSRRGKGQEPQAASRQLRLAALFLAGGSLRKLAEMEGIRPQTVRDYLVRRLGKELYSNAAGVRTRMTGGTGVGIAELEEMSERFMENSEKFATLTPAQAAIELRKTLSEEE